MEKFLASPDGKLAVENIAQICHDANRSFCKTIGDHSQPEWIFAPQWQRESAINGVLFHMRGDRKPEESHESWMSEKIAAGWSYGETKDAMIKTHPCIVPYDKLPFEQRMKDHLFIAVVHCFKKTITEGKV